MDFFAREAEARSRSRIFTFLFLMAAGSTIATVGLLAWGVWTARQRYFPIGFTGVPMPDSLEGVLTAQLLGGEISRRQYVRALERIAARDERRHPMSVPPDYRP